jgi:iron-sulfur cluster assembly accessory protein
LSRLRQSRKISEKQSVTGWHGACIPISVRIATEAPMIHLTDNAVAAIKTAISRASDSAAPGAPSAEGLRIMVQTGGCAGFKYMMGLEAESRDGDQVVRQDGVTLFIDGESQPHLAGMTVDFVTGLESSGFVFDNPNASSKCSCGKSFS